MLTSILSNSSPQNSSGLAHILSRVDYNKLNTSLALASVRRNSVHTIVLFEYVHSGVYDTIAEMERIPGTTRFIHDFLKDNEVENALKGIFATKPNMKIYSRRKVDAGSLTKHRQYVLKIWPEFPPSPILNPEEHPLYAAEVFDLYDEV